MKVDETSILLTVQLTNEYVVSNEIKYNVKSSSISTFPVEGWIVIELNEG